MSPRKPASRTPIALGPLTEFAGFLVGPGRTVVLVALLFSLFGGACYWGWQEVHGDVLASPDYMLSPEDIVVTDRPAWMSFDIREKVFQNASLSQNLSIMDPDLTERIASAFSLHPWVAKVNRVTKRYPATVMVDLEYHRPVCVVCICDELIPVDVKGNHLPARDLPPSELERYPRFECADLSTPRGPVGDRWGDTRVVGAAQIAAALGDRWQRYHLDRIEAVPAADDNQLAHTVYRLYTRSGSRIIWGAAPGAKVASEPTTEEKIAYLDEEIRSYGTLEVSKDWRRDLDLLFEIPNRRQRGKN